jgi:hypothetical protein
MKKLTYLLIMTFYLYPSCKKDNSVQLRFVVTPANSIDTLKWDSIAYTRIYYSDIDELNTPEKISDPNIYNHNVDLDLRIESITLTEGHTYVIKKFDLIGKSGKKLFYIPYEGQPGSSEKIEKLPITIPINSSMSRTTTVVRFSNL